ncbi:lipase member H-A-like [Ostrinia nubilalis]|uniref:lipase member H-A-like n=1 Tax=Ostrinia nubilalis TaxID=29057 RepID=UPI0030823F77
MGPIYFFCGQLIVASIFAVSNAMYSSKALEGYPSGYLGDCPTNKTVSIPKKDLDHLLFVVNGAKSSKKVIYNYFQTDLLAKSPHMDWTKKTIIYAGGYVSSPLLDGRAIDRHYKDLGYNVWVLDSLYFHVGIYPTIALAIRDVAAYIAEVMADMTARGLLDPTKTELLGISLGAHIVGYIGKAYYQLTGTKVSRITGLDPSGPCFRNADPEYRLDESDADFVDTVLTNIDGYGMAAPIGHVNFYVNGGEYQVADLTYFPCNVLCSHIKSFLIWMAALENPKGFIAMKCDSVQQARFRDCYENVPQVTNVLGLNVDKSKPGIYYLSTTNAFPYYLGKKGLKRENDYVKKLLRSLFRGL